MAATIAATTWCMCTNMHSNQFSTNSAAVLGVLARARHTIDLGQPKQYEYTSLLTQVQAAMVKLRLQTLCRRDALAAGS